MVTKPVRRLGEAIWGIPVDYDNLRSLETPPATPTHVPIPHFRLVDMLRHTLSFYGHEVMEEHHGLTADSRRSPEYQGAHAALEAAEQRIEARRQSRPRF